MDDLRYGDDFFHIIPKAISMKERIDKLDFFKIKNFCDNIKRMRRQATDWAKYFKR